MNPPQADFLDLYRSGLKNAASLMKASLESAERIHQQHLSAIRSALEQNTQALGELASAKSVDELLALQQKMAGAQMERLMSYWASFAQTAGESQAATIGKQMAQAREWFNDSYSLTVRATEEAKQMAAAPAPQPQARAAQKQDRPRA